MRIVIVWLFALTMLFMVTVSWWVSLPIILSVSTALKPGMSGSGLNIAIMLEYVGYVWGAVFDVFILLWAFLNSQRVDTESEAYGY